jgi:hypothetical protein
MKISRWIAGLAAVLAAGTSLAFADWKDSYRAYQSSLSAGDVEAAQRHALAVLSEPEAAVEVLGEAVELAEKGFGTANFTLPTLRFMQAETLSALQPRHRKLMGAAAETLGDMTAESRLLRVPFELQQRLILRLHDHEMWDETTAAAGSLSDLLSEEEDVEPVLAFHLETYRTSAVLQNQPERGREKKAFARLLERSRQRYQEIGAMFPPQPSIKEFDEVLAKAIAYEGLISAFQESYGFEPEPQRNERSMASTVATGLCDQEIPWTKRQMTFPRSQYGKNGAVLIGYHLGEDGAVTEARILGEVPGRSPFGERVLSQIVRWEAAAEGLPELYRRDRTTIIRFASMP